MEGRLPRKLAAILYADVVEYSRLTGEDEDATHRRLSEYLDLISRTVEHHHGQVMHYAGDAVLAMFTAVVDALACAVQIQRDLNSSNSDLPDERKLRFRVGVNMGDVIEDRGDIYGDGVNVAARLETLADPGGICISESVYTAAGNKLPLEYAYMGEQSVKNIAQPVRTYRALLDFGKEAQVVSTDPGTARSTRKIGIFAAALIVLTAGAGIAIWQVMDVSKRDRTADQSATAYVSDKPTIAVLPFANMSADPEQEYFSDGITDDLITDLSKVSGLFVIARNSVFTYKGKNAKVEQIGKDLGVRYVLEGSVRRVGNNIRINAQLIDTNTGGHLWAERYDGSIVDVFKLQDKVTSTIVAALKVELTPREQVVTEDRGTNNIAAYDIFLRGWEHLLRKSPEDAAKAIGLFEQALILDPNYSRAYAALAQAYWDNSLDPKFNSLMGFDTGQDDTSFAVDITAWKYLQKVRSDNLSQAHTLSARMLQRQRRFDEAMRAAERAVNLGPNDPAAYDVLIENLIYSGRAQEALNLVDESIGLDPGLPAEKLFLKGMANYALGRLKTALSSIERARSHNPRQTRYAAIQAAALAELGRIDEAEAALKEYLRGLVTYTTLNWTMFYWPFQERQDAERMASSLLKVGLRSSPEAYYFVAQEDRLTSEQIGHVVSNATMVGVDRGPTGLEEELEVTRDKDAQITRQEFLTYFRDGRTHIEDALLCDPWWEFGDYCIAIYRNSNGTADARDEYVFFTLASIFTFSVFESPNP
ncbi:MAG: tetratricopeptide repeat protein [Gammaproteobacteria bacterium]|nr:tetratricopeptide repeat protein [Gammaproteobacteria bacterium]